ncbi:MAG: B12-binding domain-containing radical SAM protein [Bdellovibrionota bacterium]
MKYDALVFTDFSGSIWSRGLGAYRFATYLRRKGLRVRVIDMVTEFSEDEVDAILKANVSDETKFIGISTTFLANLEKSPLDPYSVRRLDYGVLGRIAAFCRAREPRLRLIIGGTGVAAFRQLEPDLAYFGYAESEIDAFLTSTTTDVTHFSTTKTFDFSSLDCEYADTDFIEPGEALVLEVSRGCRFRCKFCAFPLNGRKTGGYVKTDESLRHELMRNYERFGTTQYFFSDDTFNESVDKLRAFAPVLASLPFKVEFAAFLRLDLIRAYPETIELLHRMGLKAAFFGIESLHEKSARAIGKGLSAEQVFETLGDLKKAWGADVHITTSYIFGLPHDTAETVGAWFKPVMSGEVHTHSVVVNPLYLIDKDPRDAKSLLEQDPEKYGYDTTSRVGSLMVWKNPHWSFEECRLLAGELLNGYHEKNGNSPEYYKQLVLRGYGYSEAETLALDMNSRSDCEGIVSRVTSRIERYKRHVLAGI